MRPKMDLTAPPALPMLGKATATCGAGTATARQQRLQLATCLIPLLAEEAGSRCSWECRRRRGEAEWK